MANKLLLAVLLASCLAGYSKPAWSEPDYEKLSLAIRRVENGPSLMAGELYGIHTVHYKDALEARQICQRTARHAWRRYLSGNQGKSTKNGYIQALSKTYCPVNWKNWARMVEFYYKGAI